MTKREKHQAMADICNWLNQADKATQGPALVASQAAAASILRRYGESLVVQLRSKSRPAHNVKALCEHGNGPTCPECFAPNTGSEQ